MKKRVILLLTLFIIGISTGFISFQKKPFSETQAVTLESFYQIETIAWEYQKITAIVATTGKNISAELQLFLEQINYQEVMIRVDNGYILMNLFLPSNTNGLVIKAELEELFKSQGVDGSVNVEMKGCIDNFSNQSEWQEAAKMLYQTGQGVIVETAQLENVYSVHGYSEGIKGHLQINKEPVNISLAMSYNEIEEHVVLYLGFPLVKENY